MRPVDFSGRYSAANSCFSMPGVPASKHTCGHLRIQFKLHSVAWLKARMPRFGFTCLHILGRRSDISGFEPVAGSNLLPRHIPSRTLRNLLDDATAMFLPSPCTAAGLLPCDNTRDVAQHLPGIAKSSPGQLRSEVYGLRPHEKPPNSEPTVAD